MPPVSEAKRDRGRRATGIDSAAVGHGWEFSEQARVYGERAAVVRGVLDDGPYDVADGLAAHDRTGRQRLGELVRAARADEVDRVCEGRFEHLSGGGERGHLPVGLGVFGKIQVEAFGPRGALDKPVDGLRRVRNLLRYGHRFVLRTEAGVGLVEDPG